MYYNYHDADREGTSDRVERGKRSKKECGQGQIIHKRREGKKRTKREKSERKREEENPRQEGARVVTTKPGCC